MCPGDEGTTEFSLAKVAAVNGVPSNLELADAWDFGPLSISWKSCSFSYHHPFGSYGLTTARDPNLAVAADRNPWIKSPAGYPQTFSLFKPDLPGYTGGTAKTGKAGNAIAHQNEGQNVLFLDGRVTFETRAYCGLDQDNIYTISVLLDEGSALGSCPQPVRQRHECEGFDSSARSGLLRRSTATGVRSSPAEGRWRCQKPHEKGLFAPRESWYNRGGVV